VSLSTQPGAPAYSFDNEDVESIDRHNYLGNMLDALTTDRLTGLGDLVGAHCLEVGAGGGSIARWLADQVGPTGRVVATDINPKHVAPQPGVEVLRHDITSEPVPDGPWDLIHARLVFLHLPEREEVLPRLVEALAPGGYLVLEEWETTFRKMVLAAPDPEAAALFELYHDLLVERVLPPKGNEPGWGSRVHATMLAEGLTDVDTTITSRSWPGGTAGALLIAANIAQLRDDFLNAGATVAQLDRMCELVNDPRLVLRGHFMYSTVGRRPRR
jgi:SAM-dependent methyltransferase